MIFGIDVSGATVDWAKVKASGVAFGIAKATEGNGFTQSQITANLKGMRAAGLVPGAYHFLVSDFEGATGEAQCDYFLARIGDPSDLIVALDVESEPRLARQPGIREVRAWVNRFKSRYPNHPVLIYSGSWYWKSAYYMNNPTGSDLGPLWDSKYVYDTAAKYKSPGIIYGFVPNTWWTPGYGGWPKTSLLQFTAWPTVPGVSGSCDASAYLGSADELKRQLINPTLPTTSTEVDSLTIVRDIERYTSPRLLTFAAGSYTAYKADGSYKTASLASSSAAHAAAKVLITQDPQRVPNGTFWEVADGIWAGYYLAIATSGVVAGDIPVPPVDCSAQVDPLNAQVASLTSENAGLKATNASLATRIDTIKSKVAALGADVAND